MSSLASALTSALIDFAWQGVLVACLLWITFFTLRNRSAHARYLASCVALLAMIAFPIITTYLGVHNAFHPTVAGSPIPVTGISPVTASTSRTPWFLWIQIWALPAWSLGVLLFSGRLFFACCQLSTLRRRGSRASEAICGVVDDLAARMGLTRTVRVLVSTLADAPGVAGFLRPVILLPISSLAGLSLQQLEAILAHELAHIRRYDPLVNAVQVLIETLLFYHPAVWWTSARIRHERELCCDDLALRYCGDALCYARALTALEKLRAIPPLLAIGSTGGSLLYRIRRIMGERPGDYSPSKLSGILALALAIACLAVNAGTRMQAQDRQVSPGVKVDTAGVEVVEPVRYPRSAAEKAIQGTVVVQLDVDAHGEVTDARVLSGPPELRKAALQSLLTWRFKSTGAASTRQISVAFEVPPLHELESTAFARESEAGRSAELFSADREGQLEAMRVLAQADAAMDKVKQLEADQARGTTEQAELQARQAELATLTASLRETELREKNMADQSRHGGTMAGRVLARIEVAGISEEQRDQLIRKLPVKVGDALSHDAIEGIRPAIRSFDERLRFELVPLENNQALLRIAAAYFTNLSGQASSEMADVNQEIVKAEGQLDVLRGQFSERHPDLLELKARLNELKQRREELQRKSIEGKDQTTLILQAQLAAVEQQLLELEVPLVTHSDGTSSESIRAQIQQLNAQRDQYKLALQQAMQARRLEELQHQHALAATGEAPAK